MSSSIGAGVFPALPDRERKHHEAHQNHLDNCDYIGAGSSARWRAPRGADKDIKLSGCLVRGEHGEGYLLTNAPGESVWDRGA